MNKLKKKIDENKISEAIEKFENEVEFEFVPVIADKSSYVEHIQWILSLIFLLLFIGTIDFFFWDSYSSKTPYYIIAPFLAVIMGSLLDKSDIVDRFFISKKERARQVHEKAYRVFYGQRLNEAKSQNALLLYISVMERKIVLLPDPRLKIEQIGQINQKLLAHLQSAFKKNQYEEGLLSCIELLKAELKDKFPKTVKHENQISNKLIWLQD